MWLAWLRSWSRSRPSFAVVVAQERRRHGPDPCSAPMPAGLTAVLAIEGGGLAAVSGFLFAGGGGACERGGLLALAVDAAEEADGHRRLG